MYAPVHVPAEKEVDNSSSSRTGKQNQMSNICLPKARIRVFPSKANKRVASPSFQPTFINKYATNAQHVAPCCTFLSTDSFRLETRPTRVTAPTSFVNENSDNDDDSFGFTAASRSRRQDDDDIENSDDDAKT